MADTVQCETHGESQQAFVCSHLLGNSTGLGFNRSAAPTTDNPFPDAWCDDCELIRAAHDGWNEESEKLIKIVLLCSGCYEVARIHNTRTTVTLGDLANVRWKCGSCDDWHTGPCLDFGYDSPAYWREEYEHRPSNRNAHETFLNQDYCAIEARDYFVRGLIHLPIIGTNETFRWGVWGSLRRENYETLLQMEDDPKRADLPPMFSWMSTQIPEYPDTLNLKMYARIQKPDCRPNFELEPSGHPLSQEYHEGISPDRVKQIMHARLKNFQSGG